MRKPGPSCERLRELMRLDAETGKLYWTKQRRGSTSGNEVGCVGPHGYRVTSVDDVPYRAHRIVWALHTGAWPTADIDHINGVKDDNRPCNLREATPSQNAANKPLLPSNKSGFRGVSWNARRRKWRVDVTTAPRKQQTLGYFDDLEFAGLVADESRRVTFGAFCPTRN